MHKPLIVYFSSATENTKMFVEKLSFPSLRIPLRPTEAPLSVDKPYILFVPTYGAGSGDAAIPPQVKKFLNASEHRRLCVGIVGSGNLNFGEKYAAAADVLSQKLQVPVLARFELRGTQTDLETIGSGISAHWEALLSRKDLN